MARLHALEIDGYRSVADEVTIRFPPGKPVVLVGENNAGKSNIVRALELVLGERWPGSHAPEDHEFFGRDPTTGWIRIAAKVQGVTHYAGNVRSFDLNCGGGGSGTTFQATLDGDQTANMSNAVREQLTCVVVGTDRDLSYQLSYASQWTLLSKLMKRFHKTLVSDETRAGRLQENFESLHSIFHEVPEFAAFAAQLQDEVGRLGTNLQYGLDIDFSAYDPSNYFRALRVQPRIGSERRTFAELGTGQEQILALGFAYAYASSFGADGSGLVLVVEEPEAHLHPLAQEWLAAQMSRFVDAGVQMVLTTHSPTFIDLCRLDGLVLTRKDDSGATYLTQRGPQGLTKFCVEHNAPKATPDSIHDFYDWSSTTEIKAGFFARTVVLVEGPTEALALPVLLRKTGLQVARSGVAVISVGGKGNLAKWWRLFACYEIPLYVVFDNDTSDDATAQRRQDVLTTLGFDEAQQRDLLSASTLIVTDRAAVFGVDFESVMRSSFSDYASLDEEAAEHLGPSKPLRARWVAERLTIGDQGPIHDLAAAIAARNGSADPH